MSNLTFSCDLVYLIDDNSTDNFVNKKMIELNTFSKEIKTFTNASEALKHLSELDEKQNNRIKIPTLIFLDLNMPLVNGFKFLELYDKLSPSFRAHCKIIILTTSINPNDKKHVLSDKNTIAFFTKPLLPDNFRELNRLIQK